MQLFAKVGHGRLRPSLEGFNLNDAIKQLLMKSWSKEPEYRPNINEFAREMSKINEFYFIDKQ